MQRYVEQLVEDLRAIAKNPPHLPENGGIPFPDVPDEEDLEELEEFVEGERRKLSEIVGLAKSALPDHKRLNDKQVNWLFDELIKMLGPWNFIPEFPDDVPGRLKYKVLRDHWDDEHVYMRFGRVNIQFCDYDPENCPFPGYCEVCDEVNQGSEILDDTDFDVSDLLPTPHQIKEHFERLQAEGKIEKIVTNKDGFISGIHNYCNRWCERCSFTKQCSVFAMKKKFDEISDAPEDQRYQLIEKMTREFFDFDEDDSDEDDDLPEFDLEDEDDDDIPVFDDDDYKAYESERNDYFSSYKKAERHPLVVKAREYSDQSFAWFKAQREKTKSDFSQMLANGTADLILEGFEVLNWYNLFIYTKLNRAMNGFYELEENEFADYDMNGSAKVALLGIDDSIEALTLLNLHLRREKTTIKHFQQMLEEIRAEAEEIFPNARNFVRPGFDEV